MSLTPSEVVAFLDDMFGVLIDHRLVEPWKAQVPSVLALQVRVFVGMVRMIPAGSMLMTKERYCEFVASMLAVDAALESWRLGGRERLGFIPGIGSLHPIDLIRRALLDGEEGATAEAAERTRLAEIRRGRSPGLMPPLRGRAHPIVSQQELDWCTAIQTLCSVMNLRSRHRQNGSVGRSPNNKQGIKVWGPSATKARVRRVARIATPIVEATEPGTMPKSLTRSTTSLPTKPVRRHS